MSTPMCSPPAPLGVAPWVPVAGSAAVAFPQPESFRDTSSVRNERERRNAALTHLCGEGRGEDSRLLFRTYSMVAFLLWGLAEGARSWICCRFCPPAPLSCCCLGSHSHRSGALGAARGSGPSFGGDPASPCGTDQPWAHPWKSRDTSHQPSGRRVPTGHGQQQEMLCPECTDTSGRALSFCQLATAGGTAVSQCPLPM